MTVLEIRQAVDRDDEWELSGYATTWSPYTVNGRRGPFEETIARGAFPGALDGSDRTALHVQHNSSTAPLASTKGGSLTFTEDARGLLMRARLPKNETDVADAVSKVRRGVLDSMSVGMAVTADDWSEDGQQRTIRRGKLYEVSLVHAPANPGATVTSVRAGDDDEVEVEVRMVGRIEVVRSARLPAASRATELESLGALRRDLGIPRRTDPDEERWKMRQVEDVVRRNRRAEREFLDRRRDY